MSRSFKDLPKMLDGGPDPGTFRSIWDKTLGRDWADSYLFVRTPIRSSGSIARTQKSCSLSYAALISVHISGEALQDQVNPSGGIFGVTKVEHQRVKIKQMMGKMEQSKKKSSSSVEQKQQRREITKIWPEME